MAPQKKKRPEDSIEAPALTSSLESAVLEPPHDDFRCERAIVEEAQWREASATGVAFDTCDFRRCAFDNSMLRRLRIVDARLDKCNASNATWNTAHLLRTEFLRCRLTGMSLSGADGRDLLIKDCKAEFLRLDGAKLNGVRFEDCILSEADFHQATLERVTFKNCDLKNVDFSQARIVSIDLRGSIINAIKLEPGQYRGLTIDPAQSLELVSLLGVQIR